MTIGLRCGSRVKERREKETGRRQGGAQTGKRHLLGSGTLDSLDYLDLETSKTPSPSFFLSTLINTSPSTSHISL